MTEAPKTPQQHYVSKPGGQKTAQQTMKTDRLKQLPGGEVVKDEKIPVPGTGNTPALAESPAPAAAASSVVQAPAKPRTMKARETSLVPRTARVQGWHFVADHGTTLADLERPEFWAGCINKLKRRAGDAPVEITVSAEDSSFWAEMVVLDTGAQWAKCRFKFPPLILDASAKGTIAYRGHTIDFAGSAWRVVRDSDHQMLRGDFQTAQTALAWLEDHVRSLAA